MVSLTALPIDVFLLIVNTLEAEKSAQSRHALLRLALTQRRVFAIVKPVLYRDVVIRESEQYVLPGFAYHVLENAEAAALVQSFTCDYYDEAAPQADMTLAEWSKQTAEEWAAWDKPEAERKWKFGQWRGWPAHSQLEATLRSHVQKVARDESDDGRWYAALRDTGNNEAMVALLLSALPNLLKFTLGPPLDVRDSFLMDVVRAAPERRDGGRSRFLSTVKEACFNGGPSKYPQDPSLFAAYLRLPNIQRVYSNGIGGIEPDNMTEEIAALEPQSSTVVDLEIGASSKLFNEDLQKLLQVPRGLETFKYHVGNAWAWYPCRSRDIITAIKHQKHSLKNITLLHGFYDWVEGLGDPGNAMDPITFKDFPVLSRLEIALPFVFGQDTVQYRNGLDPGPKETPSAEMLESSRRRLVDCLPDSIDEVCIAELEDPRTPRLLDVALMYLIEQRNEEYPKLRKLSFCFQESIAREIAEALAASLQLAKSKGIQLGLYAQKIDTASNLEPVDKGKVDLLALTAANS